MRKGGQGKCFTTKPSSKIRRSKVKPNAGKQLMESLSSEWKGSTNDPLITDKMPIRLLQCNLDFFSQITEQDFFFLWPKQKLLAATVISIPTGQQGQSSQRDAFSQGEHWIIHIMHTVFHNKLLCSRCIFGGFKLRNMLLNFIEPPGAGLCDYMLK